MEQKESINEQTVILAEYLVSEVKKALKCETYDELCEAIETINLALDILKI